jgi:proteasome lid subunit RPN8/RPN11
MSLSGGDDMVFDDLKVREPRRMRRPDRDPRLATLAFGILAPHDLPIFVDRLTAEAIDRHALSDTSVELGGILLGYEAIDEETGLPFVWVTQSLQAKHFENSQASFTYTHDSWQAITRERDERFPDLEIVGWYHTHPDFGIFLSNQDLFIQEHFFQQPLQVAYVVDPVRYTRGFFQWRDGKIDSVGGFHLVAHRPDRQALVRLVNEFENIITPDSGLSPRLEAQLMAAMQRPPVYLPAPSGPSPLLSLIAGMMTGGFALALLFMLANLLRLSGEQSETLARLERATQSASTVARQQADLIRVEAKENALDALLRDVRVGEPPDAFVARYLQAIKDRDDARDRLTRLESERDALAAHSANLKLRADTLATEIQNLRQSSPQQSDSRLQTELEATKAKLSEFETVLGSDGLPEHKRKLAYLTWAAIAGWCVAVCALGYLLYRAVTARRSDHVPNHAEL